MEANARHQHQPEDDDPAEQKVLRWRAAAGETKLTGESKLAWQYLWRQVGRRPGSLSLHVAAVGEAQGAKDPAGCGKGLLEVLEQARLIEVTARKKCQWTIYVEDPLDLPRLRRVDPDPQRELFEEPRAKPALEPVSKPVGDLRIRAEEEVNSNTPTGFETGFKAETPRPDATPDSLTLDGLTALWIETSQVRYSGRKRDRAADIKPQVQATIDAGFDPAEIAAAMRDRENVLEFYNEFHARILRRPREKMTSADIAAATVAQIEAAGKDAK